MDRIKTGISKFDDMLNGGFLSGDAVLLGGSAGTGKTTFGLQYIVNGVTQYGQNGIYLTFEQLPSQIYRDALNFGWDLHKLEKEDKFRLIMTSPNVLLEDEGLDAVLNESINAIHAKRLVIDSLSHLLMFVPRERMRREAYRLIMYTKTKGLSSLCSWESQQLFGEFSVTDFGISFLVDGIVLLKFVEIASSMKTAMTILKMRGTQHSKDLVEYQITKQGITIGEPFVQYEALISGTPRRSIPASPENGYANNLESNGKEKRRDR